MEKASDNNAGNETEDNENPDGSGTIGGSDEGNGGGSLGGSEENGGNTSSGTNPSEGSEDGNEDGSLGGNGLEDDDEGNSSAGDSGDNTEGENVGNNNAPSGEGTNGSAGSVTGSGDESDDTETDDEADSDKLLNAVTEATPSTMKKASLPAEDGVYKAGSLDEYEKVLAEIAELEDGSEVTLLLTASISNNSNRFAGVSGKRITVTSDDTAPKEGYRIELGQEMEGDVILDKVFITTSENRPIYANGHLFMTTENLPVGRTAGYSYYGRIYFLFGGGSKGNDVKSTNLVLNGGQIENVYGGGHDSNVTGDVHITLDGNANAGNFYGGGFAEETGNGKVLGNVIVEAKSGMLRSFLGGGNNQYSDASENRTPAEVKGNIFMTFGYKGAPEQSMRIAYTWDSGGGSENSTVGNVILKFLEGSATNPDNALDISGAGFNDDVKGTIKIFVDGGQIDTVFGAGFEDYRKPVFINGHRTRILNENDSNNAIYINIVNVKKTDDFLMTTVDGLSFGISGSQKSDLVNGDVTIEVENSDIDQVCIGGRTTNYSTEWAELEGEGNIIIKDSNVYAIRGHKVNYENKKNTSNVYFEGTEHSEIGYTYWVDNVTVSKGADVMIGSDDLWGDEMLPFYKTRNLSVLSGAKLVTSNADTAYSANILKNATIDGGEWIARGYVKIGTDDDSESGNLNIKNKGKLSSESQVQIINEALLDNGTWIAEAKNGLKQTKYVYGKLTLNNQSLLESKGQIQLKDKAEFDNSKWISYGTIFAYEDIISKNSKFYWNCYFNIGFNYKNNSKGFTAFTSNNDKLVSKDSSLVNEIYGSADITNSDIAFLCPANVSGDWVANGDTKLILPAVKAGENYDGVTSNLYIPLNIDGTASGKATVYTVSETDENILVTPTLGDNYITGFAPNGTGDGANQDNPIQATFVLGNQDALRKGYYLKRVLDPMPSHSRNYYMWQVAQGKIPEPEKNEYTVKYKFVSTDGTTALPDGVRDLLPTDNKTYEKGQSITILNPSATVVGVTDGRWDFKVWDKPSPITAGPSADPDGDGVIVITGTWSFTEKPEPPVEHKLTLSIQDVTAYTGGDSVNSTSFPAPRFGFAAGTTLPEGGITFTVTEGTEESSTTVTDAADIFLITGIASEHRLKDGSSAEASDDDSKAGIYEISIPAEEMAKLKAVDTADNEYELTFNTGELTVRYVSDPEGTVEESVDVAEPILREEPTDIDRPVALIPEGSTFATNGREELHVLDDDEDALLRDMISLMSDELLSEYGEDRRADLIEQAEKHLWSGNASEDRQYEFKYLDLINEHDGNAWVSSSKGSDIYWPYPEGTDKETEFVVIHFPGLHREYDFEDRDSVEEAIAACVPEFVTILDKTEAGIKFHVPESGFSPFAISWTEGADEPGGGEEKPDPGVPGGEEKPGEEDKPDDKPDDKPSSPGGTGGGDGGGGSTGGGGSFVERPGYVFEDNKTDTPDDTKTEEKEDDTPGYIPPHPEYNKLPVMGAEVLGPGYIGGIKLTEADGGDSYLPSDDLSTGASETAASDASGAPASEPKIVIPELAGYHAQNNDLLGWIAVPGTGAGYPVMNDPELPTYYLHHTFDREADDVGIPFTAPFCTPDSDNILIHGHNMNGKLQFGNIWNYQYPSFRDKHPVIDFKTIYDSESQYEVMAIFFAPVYDETDTGVFKWYQYAGDMNKNQFEYYVQNVKALSLYDTGVTAEYGDKLITLETCANSHDSTRLVVVARKRAK